MTFRHQLWLGGGLAAVLSGLLLLALGRVALAPRSDRAAVMALLDQRGIAYSTVDVRPNDPGVPRDHFAYVAAVEVAAEPPAYGTIACAERLDVCVVSIDSLGVRQQALPRVVPAELWVAPLRRELRTAAGWLRSWLSTSPASRPGAGTERGPRHGA